VRECQKCRKCGKVFAEVDRNASSIGGTSDLFRHVDEKTCPRCGGSVIWVDEDDQPLSISKRVEEVNRHLRLGCLWGIIALLGLFLLWYLVLR